MVNTFSKQIHVSIKSETVADDRCSNTLYFMKISPQLHTFAVKHLLGQKQCCEEWQDSRSGNHKQEDGNPVQQR